MTGEESLSEFTLSFLKKDLQPLALLAKTIEQPLPNRTVPYYDLTFNALSEEILGALSYVSQFMTVNTKEPISSSIDSKGRSVCTSAPLDHEKQGISVPK